MSNELSLRPAAGALTGTELLPILQSGEYRKIAIADLPIGGGGGGDGDPGLSAIYVFRRAAEQPATPTANSGKPPSGWSLTTPSGTDPLYATLGYFVGDTATQQGTWTAPLRFTGETGPQGLRGLQGLQGAQGQQGAQGGQGERGLQGIQGPQGPQGPAGAGSGTVLPVDTLATLKATPLSEKIKTLGDRMYVAFSGDYSGGVEPFVVKSDSTALSSGAWVMQSAGSIQTKRPEANTRRRALELVVGETWTSPDSFNGSSPAARLQACYDNMTPGSNVMTPNGQYTSELNQPITISKVGTYTFQKDVTISGLRNPGNQAPTLRIAITSNPMGAEGRAFTVHGNGARINIANNGSGGPFGAGLHALAINDTFATDPVFPILGMDVYNLQAVGGQGPAMGVYGGVGGTLRETLFARFHSCQVTGGFLFACSDGAAAYDCHGLPGDGQPDLPFVEVNVVPGAFLNHVWGGTTQCRGGAIRITNGDFGLYEGIQCEYDPSAGATNATMVDVIGADRPAIGNMFRSMNFGQGLLGMIAAIRLRNCYATAFHDNYIFPSRVDSQDNYIDLILETGAKNVIWGHNPLRGNRSVQPGNVVTDLSRRLRVSLQSTAVLANQLLGLWVPIQAGVPSTSGNRASGQGDFQGLRGWTATGDAAYLIPPGGGSAMGRGKLTGGTLTAGDIAFLPEQLSPTSLTEVLLESATGQAAGTVNQYGAIETQAALPDAAIYLAKLLAQIPIQHQRQYAIGA